MLAPGHQTGQETCIRNEVPREREGDVLVAPRKRRIVNKGILGKPTSCPHSLETVSIVPEVVLCVHVLQIQDCIVSPFHNLVPQHDLVQFIVRRLVLGREVQEELLHVPVEQRI